MGIKRLLAAHSLTKTLFLLCLIATQVQASDALITADSAIRRDPKKNYLEMQYLVRDSKGPDKADEKKTVKGVIIKVMNEKNYLVATYFTAKNGKCEFRLPLDKKFTLLISKTGYVTKIVEVNTIVPKDVSAAFIFPADIAIFQVVEGLNTSILNKPVARVQFNTMQRDFQYDIVYTNRVNSELKKMYKEYYTLQRQGTKKKKG